MEGVRIERVTEHVSHPLDRWVDGIRARSDQAFRAVYDSLSDDLLSFAYGMVSDRSTAEDIVQDAFIELVQAAPKFRGDGRSLASWLYRSVRFGCLDEYRRRKRRPERPTDQIGGPSIDDDHMESLDPNLERALMSLSQRHRTLVLLRHVVGLSGQEIADVTGGSRKAAYAALDRAERKLRVVLGVSDG